MYVDCLTVFRLSLLDPSLLFAYVNVIFRMIRCESVQRGID